MKLSVFRRAREAFYRHGSFLNLIRHLTCIFNNEGVEGLAYRLRHLFFSIDKSWLSPFSAKFRRPQIRIPREKPANSLPKGILLVGHPYAVLGRSEDIRTVACSLDSVGIPFAIRNLFGGHGRQWTNFHQDFPFFHRVDEHACFRTNLFVLNANEMESAWRRQGDTFRDGHYNIGYWAWELSRFPSKWLPSLTGLDEVWAPSRFIQQAIAETTEIPVIWMPLAVEPILSARASRAALGLPESKFLFLFFFDFRSYISRKNPWDVIRAFDIAFKPSNNSVGLVIKINGMDEKQDDYRDFLRSKVFNDPRLFLIDRVLSDYEVKSLVSQCDCFVSLHRSEGFGRGLAEAMYLGKPVIATGYSGNLDFMNLSNSCLVDHRLIPVGPSDYPFGEGQLWAEPDVDMAARFMVRLVDDSQFAQEIAQSGSDYVRRHHSYSSVGARYRRRLEALDLL